MYNFPSNLEYNKLSDTRNQINFEWRKGCSVDTILASLKQYILRAKRDTDFKMENLLL